MSYMYSNVKLEKGMYNDGAKSFTQVLESLDPSENYYGTPLEGLDAFQRQLKHFDIKVKGAYSDTVEKFFRTSESAVLFPEYVSRVVHHGMEESSLLHMITASTTNIETIDYRSIAVPVGEKYNWDNISEGSDIPPYHIQPSPNLTKLHKRGRMLVCSYNAVRYQKLDLFSVVLRQIGAHIVHAQLEDAVKALVGADRCVAYLEPDVVYYGFDNAAFADLFSRFDPYAMSTIVASMDATIKILSLPEFQNFTVRSNWHGNLITPLGIALINTNVVPEKTAVALDKRFALEMVRSGGIYVDYDRLIDRQFECTSISAIAGFTKIFPNAVKIIRIE